LRLAEEDVMTEFLDVDGGRIAYDVTGSGPLVVLSHGIGDRRQVYRFLAPRLAQAGYRVATADLRGHGESSMGWTSVTGTEAITRTDIAGDLLALIRHLGGPAVIIGHSISGGAATIAAAKEPELVSGIVEINPFTRTQRLNLGGFLRIRRYRRGISRLMGTQVLRSLRMWMRYLDVAYPTKPADYAEYVAALAAKLREPGRMAEFMKTGKSTPADAAAQLPKVARPALVIMGSLDPDFADPRAEGEAVVAAMPSGLGTVAMAGGGGHYPHAQLPDEVAALVIPFLKEHARA
jgi:pimeloyl-ACP methyl ester carboxylesterase